MNGVFPKTCKQAFGGLKLNVFERMALAQNLLRQALKSYEKKVRR